MSSYAVRIAELLHPYGHGRAENLAAFGEGLILLLTAAVIAFEAVRRLVGEPVHVDPALAAAAQNRFADIFSSAACWRAWSASGSDWLGRRRRGPSGRGHHRPLGRPAGLALG